MVKGTCGIEMALLLLVAGTLVQAKERSRLVTAEMRAHALENVRKYAWAREEQEQAIAQAKPWLQLSDDQLWALPSSQELPRDIHTNKEVGCPNCGDGIGPYGNYPWKIDFWNEPWRITCPNCGEKYPRNDFYAFYQTALDEHGFFRRELGDRSLLFNAEHPDPNDPLHQVFVDDGYGMMDEQGRRHRAIAYYVQWGHWASINRGLNSLARAYALTSDSRYAHKAAILLDRVADVYPEMDFMPLHQMGFEHSHGGSGRGRIQGCIWETVVAHTMATTYDTIFDALRDDAELVPFCSRKAQQYQLGDKSSQDAICRHIEDHLLVELLGSVKDGRIDGNTGATHTALATVAIALDRGAVTEEWLDWLFDPAFPGDFPRNKDAVPWVLVEGLDRDGMGGECGGYGLIWSRSMMNLAEILQGYTDYTKHDLVAEFPKLKQAFLIESRLNCLDTVMPNIGDCGSTGAGGRVGNAQTFARGFKLFQDPRLARLAWRHANGELDQLRLPNDIFEADPEALGRAIAQAAQVEPLRLRCDHLGRYGLAYLQTEVPENGRAVWIHYGYGKGHSHRDCLNIGLYAKNVDLLPELGYPEYTGGWPKRHAWTANTISHNTLLVNDTQSGYSPGGKLHLFAVQPPLRALEASSSTAYEGLRAYRRTVALVDVSDSDSYVLDVFRAQGGRNHRLSYHGPAETAAIQGLTLFPQATGTFAGPDVDFATLEGEQADFYRKSGFTYLYDVERTAGAVEGYYTVDWKAEDLRGRISEGREPHLRLHALTPCDEVALASGDPPQNRRGVPRRLRYLLQSRLGENLESQFVTVLEPYDRTPFIRRVRRLTVEHETAPHSVVAVAVELENGTTDILISCAEPTRVRMEGGVEFEGKLGMVRSVEDEVQCLRMCQGRLLKTPDRSLVCDQPAYTGRVVRVDVSDPKDHRVFLEPGLPRGPEWLGRTIHFRSEWPGDTSYDIQAVGEGWISTGELTLVAGFQDRQDFTSGFRYLVNPGDEYVAPNCVGWDR